MNLKNQSSFSRWNYGTRSVVARLTSSLNPTTELNISATYKTSHFTESGFANDYQITDKTTGSTGFQGLGYFQNPSNQDMALILICRKLFFFTAPTPSRSAGDMTAQYLMPIGITAVPAITFRLPMQKEIPNGIGAPAGLVGTPTSAGFYLSNAPAACPLSFCPLYAAADGTDHQVYLRQVRGLFSAVKVNSAEAYHAIYGNDNFAINRYVTIDAGLRWERAAQRAQSVLCV